MVGNFDTSVLRSFVATAQSGSLARAATLMGRSQPSVSQQLMRLEDIVGRRLLDRGPRGAKLTKSGEAFLVYAQRILSLTDEVIDHFQPRQFTGHIALGVIEDFAFGFLTEALIDFAKMQPDLEMEVIVAGSDSMREDLRSGRLDLALGDPALLSPYSVWQVPLPLGWYANENFDVGQSPLPLVMFSKPCSWREPSLEGLNGAGLRWRIMYESSSLQAINAAVAAGLGMACYLKKAAPSGTRALVGIADIPKAPVIKVGMAVRDSKTRNPATNYLLDLVHRLLTG